MTTILNRRAILAGAAVALPAAALPATAMPNPDAELLALGARLQQILPPLLDLSWRSLKDWDNERPDLTACSGELEAQLRKWEAEHPAGTEANRLWEQAEPIVEKILAIPPQSLAGLAVLAQAVAVTLPTTMWHDDDESEHRGVRALIEATCALAGTPHPCKPASS
jgi:hypothetical protein